MSPTDKCSVSYWRVSHCCAGSPTGQSVGTTALPEPHGFVMLMSQYKMRSGFPRGIRANTAIQKKLLRHGSLLQQLLLSPPHQDIWERQHQSKYWKDVLFYISYYFPHTWLLIAEFELTCNCLLYQLRKPIVEKMRRDRINSCIDQLKVILEKEFHKQEPNSKLEKADILEMTVSFLRQQLQPGLCHSNYNQGYSQCWRDSMHFLSAGSSPEASVSPVQSTQQEQLHQPHRASSTSPVSPTPRPTMLQDSSSSSRGPVWRPW